MFNTSIQHKKITLLYRSVLKWITSTPAYAQFIHPRRLRLMLTLKPFILFQEWSSYYFKENIVLLYISLSIYSAPYMLFHFVFVLWKINLVQSFLQNLMLSILGFLVSSMAFTWRNRYPRNAIRDVWKWHEIWNKTQNDDNTVTTAYK